jgi:nucleoside 2-deoxyribosyltransferase
MATEGLPDVGILKKDLWYIAGPFFNPAQSAVIDMIEQTFTLSGVEAFSPRLCDENRKGPPTKEGAEIIFERNVKGLLKCSHMIAVLDWKLPAGQVIRGAKMVDHFIVDEWTTPPLNIPDSGTVFEMGAAHMKTLLTEKFNKLCGVDPLRLMGAMYDALETSNLIDDFNEFRTAFVSLIASLRQMPIVIYTERSPKESINLMLTVGTKGVLNGPLALKQFLGKGDLNWNVVKPWTGENR